MSDTDMQSAAELSSRMLAKDLWAAFSTPVASEEERAALLPEHLRHMVDLEERGIVFASGPLLDDDGHTTGEGLTIFRARSRDEAETIAHADPYVRDGMRTVDVRRWRVMEGRVALTVSFSDQSYTLD